ncbi:hypothetical protein M5X00_09355 [Paenibacillus alvei]|uniref:hypothetical protein n=1 Tax=Paenibacillus TaxID=44249 RepID=UPI0002881770|nr:MULTISPECIES: hypothetical protein [Paenibacillus]EJW18116.1 hypothetical protein PAV_3c05660 [Paenibacillus alvei DSM 29]MCY9542164.1 hypothetical protein [Paenibacillus alvei]MCY9703608.1 hypothetical protein [Paenibacillus alvei]MCY9732489.1 hypothetical protein [Paenibacillus alvei]MCY9754453.1 hypothetical protein [Paenibacillus alvei]
MQSRQEKWNREVSGRSFRRHISRIELCSLASKWLIRALLVLVISVVIAQCLLLGGASRQWLSPVDKLEGIPFHPYAK